MLSERLVRAQPDRVREGLRRRGSAPETYDALERWLALDGERRTLASEHDTLAASKSEPLALRADTGTAQAARRGAARPADAHPQPTSR